MGYLPLNQVFNRDSWLEKMRKIEDEAPDEMENVRR